MSALYDSGLEDSDPLLHTRPFPAGTIVHYLDLERKECVGRVKDASLYILWVEDVENRDRTIFIRYNDVTAVFE